MSAPPNSPTSSSGRQVLSEEAYIEGLSDIIERDYYPTLWNLRHGRDLDASTAFERDSTPISNSRPSSNGPIAFDDAEGKFQNETSHLSLQQYQSLYTSVDNQSFLELITEEKQHRQEQLERQYGMGVSLRAIQAAESSSKTGLALAIPSSNSISIQNVQASNQALLIPGALPPLPLSLQQKVSNLDRSITCQNTRIDPLTFVNSVVPLSSNEASTPLPSYGYLNTPVIQPGEGPDESPITTWGRLESTPIPIDAVKTPFRIQDPVPREVVAEKLQMRASHQHLLKQARKKGGKGLVSLGGTPTPNRRLLECASKSPFIQSVLRREAKSRSQIDTQLRAAYSGVRNKKPSLASTPAKNIPTPTPATFRETETDVPTTSSHKDITDDLLSL